MKNEWKIRRMLDIKKYHLCTSNTGEWSLYRYYDNWEMYMSPDNEPIMTHKTHTEKDLLKFAKERRIIDASISNSITRIVLCYINLLIFVASIMLDSNFLRGSNWTLNIFIIIWALIDLRRISHNSKVLEKEVDEDIKLLKERIKNELEKIGGDNENI